MCIACGNDSAISLAICALPHKAPLFTVITAFAPKRVGLCVMALSAGLYSSHAWIEVFKIVETSRSSHERYGERPVYMFLYIMNNRTDYIHRPTL